MSENVKDYLFHKGTDFLHREDVQEFVASTGVELLKLKKYLNLYVQGQENVARAAKLMKDHSGLIIFNHLSIFDLLPIFIITQDGFGEDVNYMYPASTRFFPESTNSFESPFITSMIHMGAKRHKLELIPTVQHGGHDLQRETYSGTSGVVNPNFSLLRNIKKKMKKPGNVLVMSQEGGRSRTGAMIKAEREIDFYVELNTVVVPFSIWGTEKIHSIGEKRFHPFAPIHAVVGEPLTYDHLHREAEEWGVSITTLASLHTARNLPKKYRGCYDENRFPEFFSYYAMPETLERWTPTINL